MRTSISAKLLRRMAAVLIALLALAACVAGAWSCAPSGFQDASLVQNGVRILASSTTEPYAAPGDQVTISVLAVDGRTTDQFNDNPESMHLYWLTTLCVNPPQDAYYACFPQVVSEFAPFESDAGTPAAVVADAGTPGAVVADAGTPDGDTDDAASPTMEGGSGDGGAALSFDGAVPLVSSVGVSVPTGIIIPRTGATPYGLLFKFNIACAGHLQLLAPGPNPQALPIGCFDKNGIQLGPESYVIGVTRIYVYNPGGPATMNHNPVIAALDTPQSLEPDGALPLSPPETIAVDGGDGPPNLTAATPFFAPLCLPDAGSCDNPKIGAIVPPSSWERAANGVGEQIWAEYFTTLGGFSSSSRLLYDPTAGAIVDPDTKYQPPAPPPNNVTTGLIWIVVHDNRGGAAWVTVPLKLVPPSSL
ncbi:MAG TPA: hypothetical protein VK841_16030 [Polyangiaceae bacterium]|nr:hypothetical protein [Polyangiaceae bacterium]